MLPLKGLKFELQTLKIRLERPDLGEFFRLVAGVAHCRDVVACAHHGLQAIRCPPGLAFDLGKQTCEWRNEVRGRY